MRTIVISHFVSPPGTLVLGSIDRKLCLCDWDTPTRREVVDARLCQFFNAKIEVGSSDITQLAAAQLSEYFTGRRRGFDVPIAFSGTAFQQKVRSSLLSIPYAATLTYAQMAQRVGRPTAVRAVASAIASNPVSIFIPCHRVIGANGHLTGYAGGLDAKKSLLNLEKIFSCL